MTIDEAIAHCLEVAEKNETKAQKIGVQFLGTTKDREATECRECAADHRQLAEWLMELKEAKRLLKAAVEDIYKARKGWNCSICDMPPEPTERCQYEYEEDCQFKWLYEDEVQKVIGGE